VLRLPVVGILVVGTVIAIGRVAPVRWAWAAAVPVALNLAWEGWPAPVPAAGGADCADPASALAIWRMAQAVIVLGVLAALAMIMGATRSSLGLRMPARRYVRWAVAGFLVTGPVALLIGPLLACPFFGPIAYDVTVLGAIVPALAFATANGVLEEVTYRGALLGWSARVMGVGPAMIGQAVVFGLAHSGPDVVGYPLFVMVALGTGGLIAGVITVRTGSLLIPVAIHIGLDIPLYYGLACAN
jgi:membrane protease YdiL (CAAX protease family)